MIVYHSDKEFEALVEHVKFLDKKVLELALMVQQGSGTLLDTTKIVQAIVKTAVFKDGS